MNDRSGRAIPISVLLLLAVLVSAGSGAYAGASFFPLQSPNVTVTTTIYTTTTSWTTSTLWSTVTQVVQGVLTTVEYTTSTSTVTVMASSTTSSSSTSSTSTGARTVLTITQLLGSSGRVVLSGTLKDALGRGVASAQVRVLIDGQQVGTTTTSVTGAFTYSGTGPTSGGVHTVTVIFDGNSKYAPSQASQNYTL